MAVIAIAIVAVVALGILGGDQVRDKLEVGDYVEYTGTIESDGVSSTITEKYTIVEINSNGDFVVEVTGILPYKDVMTHDEFMALFVVTGQELEKLGYTESGTAKIETEFGKRECTVYKIDTFLGTETIYLGVDNNVKYLEIDILGIEAKLKTNLIS